MTAKIIIVTGISGSGSRQFCLRYNTFGKKIKRYHTGDMLFELAQKYSSTPILKENLLNLRPDILDSLRDNVFETLVNNLEQDKKNYDIIFIDTHAQFFWNDVYQNAYNWRYLKQISADMFITIIDKPSAIKENQIKTPHGRAQSHDLRDLLLWQNIEVNVTAGWAFNYEKPVYVFSSKQNPEIINSLFENKFLIYSSFPMTDAGGENWNKINRFKEKLRNIKKEIDGIEAPMIDPADIDIETGDELTEKEKDAINRQTVHRDLNWDIAQSTHVIAYYPDDKVNLSKGVSDECTRALETGKYVYVICPREKISPFMNIAHKVFRNEDEFLEFFKEHLREILYNLKRK